MSTIIILYMLVCYKVGLGVEWYDWCLLSAVMVLNIVGGVLEHVNKTKNTSPTVKKLEESFFSDIVSGKKKDGK